MQSDLHLCFNFTEFHSLYCVIVTLGVRSAMRAASQLPEKGPADVDDAPAPAP